MYGPEDSDPDMLVLPHILDVNLSFLPIHNFLPRKGVDTPFILPNYKGIDGKFFPEQQWLRPVDEVDANSAPKDTTLDIVKKYLSKNPSSRLKIPKPEL